MQIDLKSCLKNYRKILFSFRDHYKLKVSDLEFLFFIYDLRYFTGTTIKKDYQCSLTFITRNLPDLVKNGYISVYLERSHNRARRYAISQRGKIIVTKFCTALEQEVLIKKLLR